MNNSAILFLALLFCCLVSTSEQVWMKNAKKSSFKTSFISLSLATTRTHSSWTKSRSRWSVQSGAHQKTTMWVQSNNDFWFWLIVAVVADFCPFCKVFLTFFFTKKAFFQGTPYLYGYNFLWGKQCFSFFQSMTYSTLVWRFPKHIIQAIFLGFRSFTYFKGKYVE